MSVARGPLAGRSIVLTRPAAQNDALASRIEALGGCAARFPTLEIRDVEDTRVLDALIERLDEFDLAIFASPNAAEKGLAAVRRRRALPSRLVIAAVGRGTARALERLGVAQVVAPQAGDDSESLLALPALRDVRGRRVVVFRGVGGRALIRDTLEARGASVEYAECYRRVKPQPEPGALACAFDRGEIDAVVVTSSEGLRNLWTMVQDPVRDRLARTTILATHARIAAAAHELGLTRTLLSEAGDEGIVAALLTHFSEPVR